MRRLAMFGLAWLIFSGGHAFAQVDEVIRYPRAESAADRRNDYALELLQLALTEAGSTARLLPSEHVMPQQRSFSELQSGKHLQVLWAMTTKERERQALPIRVPIYKGLIGWRLMLVHASQSDLLADVYSAADLVRFRAGQAQDWPDTDILRANQLPVVATSGYENLFSMLGQGRFDYMPRSIEEIWAEAQAHRADGAIVDQYIVVHYPAAAYFFVSGSNRKLAETISTGLYRAIGNGKFDRLFYNHFAVAIEQARLSHRRVVELENPSLPEATPLKNTRLWLRFPRASAVGPSTRPRANSSDLKPSGANPSSVDPT